ncbi:hypothetical protein EVAR_78999_1 [Eumeta japonica]|uniref:Uncharacterized protein n=1 Tax=Eumeta variegata TaxID=151549 RepID=A0A4C1UTI3_EUMVA|nr:hypothetical protein EVAR_78999_1 [Eumeta japonica]
MDVSEAKELYKDRTTWSSMASTYLFGARTDERRFYSCNNPHMKSLAVGALEGRRRATPTCYFVTLASVAGFIVLVRIRAKKSDIEED